MNRELLTNEIQAIAREIFNTPDLVIIDSLCPTDLDSWTSLSFMRFLSAIENKYSFRFRMTELLLLRNMGAVIDTTLKHVG